MSTITRQLAALAGAAIVWIISWGTASFLAFAVLLGASDGGRGAPEPAELIPAAVFAVVGPILALFVGWRLWPRA